MKVTIFKDSSRFDAWVEFKNVVEAIRLGNNQKLFFAPSGVIGVSGNKKNTLIYSGIMMFSLSANSKDELEGLFRSVIELSITFCCFRNHEENCLNVFVKTDSLEGHHKTAYEQVANTYENYLNLKVSNRNPDVNILCPVSSDPEIYYNFNCTIFQVDCKRRKYLVIEAQLDEIYKEAFDKAVEYTMGIVQFEGENKDAFIYTLADNCFNEAIPMVKTLELIMGFYGYSMPTKEIVKRAYKKGRNNNKLNVVFSFFLRNLRNYKDGIPIETRVLFEFFILTYIHFEGQLNFSEKQFKQELGIAYSRRIINDYIEKGFLFKGKILIQRGNKKVPKNTFSINPDMIPVLANEYIIDSSKFLNAIMPLVKRVQEGQGGYFFTSYTD